MIKEYHVPPRIGTSLPIRVEQAAKTFGRRRLWSEVSFEVHSGQVLALAGRSGSGKTTLLNCLGLLERIDSGRIVYGSTDVTNPRGALRRVLYKNSIGFLFQNSGLVDSWSVRQNLLVALNGHRIGRRTKRQHMETALDQMGLGGMQDDLVYTLSGGEQQRVGLARLLLREVDLVLADEPTASLDAENSEMVVSALRFLADRGAAVVISTHDERAIEASDGIVRLEAMSREWGSRATVDWREGRILSTEDLSLPSSRH
jgi:putative ABC transport system ATP-binding protein